MARNWPDRVPEVHVDAYRQARRAKRGIELHSNARVFVFISDRLCFYAGGVERQSIDDIETRDRADAFGDLFGIAAESGCLQINVFSRTASGESCE